MLPMKRSAALVVGLLAVLVIAAPPARAQSQQTAQTWPTRTVKFIVPFGPGAGADIGARLFAERLAARWGQPVVVENKPGGDSIVAINAFLGANDDHTFLFGPSGNFYGSSVRVQQIVVRPQGSHPDRPRLQHHPGGRGSAECPLRHAEGIH
jgi:tripartite-type tricarboxylate transporter receptor subunit TctC